jgi:hypothetical protein
VVCFAYGIAPFEGRLIVRAARFAVNSNAALRALRFQVARAAIEQAVAAGKTGHRQALPSSVRRDVRDAGLGRDRRARNSLPPGLA